tara:strand:- start:6544 stop:8010 length:1467 start_codon:yes stop_codon:yes gene_type:complete
MHVQIDRVFTTVARNLGLKDFSRYTNNFIEWAYEAEKLIGSRDTFIQKEATYDASGAKATGTITFATNPVSGDSITLNGVKLYFRNSTDLGKAKSPNEIQIGGNLGETFDNTNAQYGLIQSLKGFINTTDEIGKYIDSAIYNYPEALNIADYSFAHTLGSELADATQGSLNGVGGTLNSASSVTFVADTGTDYWEPVATGLVSGKLYLATATVTGYAGTNTIGFGAQGGLSTVVGESRLNDNGSISHPFISDGGEIRIFAGASVAGTISDISVKEIVSTVLTVTAKEIGPKGNEYSLSSDNANAKVSGLNLAGGKGIYRNQQITLPENNIKVLGIRVGEDDSDHKHSVLQKTSAVHRQRVGKTSNSSEQKAFRYYIEGNRLNIQHDNLDEITVVYMAYPTDIRGWPKIKEGHETAVAQYIMWQMKLIEFYNGKLPQYITKELEKRWYILCGKARGDDGMPTSQELKQIGNMWNTLVPVTNDRSTLTDF